MSNNPEYPSPEHSARVIDALKKASEDKNPMVCIVRTKQEDGSLNIAVMADHTTEKDIFYMFLNAISSLTIQIPDFDSMIATRLAINGLTARNGIDEVTSIGADGSRETIFKKPAPEPEKPEQAPAEQAVS